MVEITIYGEPTDITSDVVPPVQYAGGRSPTGELTMTHDGRQRLIARLTQAAQRKGITGTGLIAYGQVAFDLRAGDVVLRGCRIVSSAFNQPFRLDIIEVIED